MPGDSVYEISATDALRLLKEDKSSILIDVRTEEELCSVGYPDLDEMSAKYIFIAWRLMPFMEINAGFSSELEDKLNSVFGDDAKSAKLVFLCRSGVRSMQAALHAKSDLGYKNCYNLVPGFEGSGEFVKYSWRGLDLPFKIKKR